MSITTYSANKFDLLDRKTANCAAAILTSLRGDLISSKIHFFSFFLPPFLSFYKLKNCQSKGLIVLGSAVSVVGSCDSAAAAKQV